MENLQVRADLKNIFEDFTEICLDLRKDLIKFLVTKNEPVEENEAYSELVQKAIFPYFMRYFLIHKDGFLELCRMRKEFPEAVEHYLQKNETTKILNEITVLYPLV